MTDLVAALRAAIDESEAWARAASQTQAPGTPTGEHWQWECSHCDTPITINPVTDSTVECPQGCSADVSLRSVEQYPTTGVRYTLPAFIVSSVEEVPATAGALIVRHDPAAVLRRCVADRKILDLHRSYDEEYPDHADPDHPERQCVGCGFDGQEEVRVADVNRCPVVGALAEAYGVEA